MPLKLFINIFICRPSKHSTSGRDHNLQNISTHVDWLGCYSSFTVLNNSVINSSGWSQNAKPVHPKGNQSWIFTGRTDAEDRAPILWPPDVKSQLIGTDPDAGKDWGQEEKGTIEDEMAASSYRLNEHEFEQTLGDSEGQGSLVDYIVHGVAKSWTQLGKWTTTIILHTEVGPGRSYIVKYTHTQPCQPTGYHLQPQWCEERINVTQWETSGNESINLAKKAISKI